MSLKLSASLNERSPIGPDMPTGSLPAYEYGFAAQPTPLRGEQRACGPSSMGLRTDPPTAGSRGTPAPGVVPTGVSRGRSTGAIPPDVMRTWPDAMRRQPTGAAISAE